jgi:hypothetical protein
VIGDWWDAGIVEVEEARGEGGGVGARVETVRDCRERIPLGSGVGIQEQEDVSRRDVRCLVDGRAESAVVLVDQDRRAGPEREDLGSAAAVFHDDE